MSNLYFPHPISKLMFEKGLVSETEMWWVHVDSPMLHAEYLGQPLNVDFVLVPTKDCEFKIWDEEGGEYYPAYSTFSILLSENSRLWWGEAPYTCKWCGYKSDNNLNSSDHCDRGYYDGISAWTPNHIYHSHQYLDLIQSGADIEALTKYLLDSKE